MNQTIFLSDYLHPEMVIDLDVRTKDELLDAMLSNIAKSDKVLDIDIIRKAITEREKGPSTGIGNGFAIPHARTKGVSDFVISVARLKNPLDYGSDDKVPVSLVFMIIATEQQDDQYIRLLSRLILRLRNEEFVQEIMHAENSNEVYELIRSAK